MARWQGDEPVVSILCATYQHVGFIEDALRGFLGQTTDFPFEILVRDDASGDGTAEIVRDYAKRYPNIIRAVLETENHYQVLKPLQVLEPMARGEFVSVCEGDDFWIRPDILAACTSHMRSHSKVSAVLVDGVVVENDQIIYGSEQRRAGVSSALTIEQLLLTHYLPVRGLMRRADCVLPELDLEFADHAGDQLLPIRFALRQAVVENLNLEACYVYRVASNPQSATAKSRTAPIGQTATRRAARQLDIARLLRDRGHPEAARARESEALVYLAQAALGFPATQVLSVAWKRVAQALRRRFFKGLGTFRRVFNLSRCSP